MSDTPLDGNAAAGALGRIFAAEITAAVGRCASCGNTGAVAEMVVYADAPGTVLRCRGCDAVQLRVVEADGRMWLDVRGVQYLQFAL